MILEIELGRLDLGKWDKVLDKGIILYIEILVFDVGIVFFLK